MSDTSENAETQRGKNTVSSEELRSFIERLERVGEEKKGLADFEKQIYAEIKARGYTPKYIRAILKLRKKQPSERDEDEAMLDLYSSAVGMAQKTPPLFRSVAQMGVDVAAKEAVIEALKLLVPKGGEIVVRTTGPAVRLFRDAKGAAHAEEVSPAKPSVSPASKEDGGDILETGRSPAPDCTPDEAEEMGRQAYRDDLRIVDNPFPWDHPHRHRWDLGWRKESGSDGMGEDD